MNNELYNAFLAIDKNNSCSFANYIESVAKYYQPYVAEVLKNAKNMYSTNQNMHLDKYLYTPLENYINNHGKLHRPLLCLSAYMAFLQRKWNTEDFEFVSLAAGCVEMFQCAALIHDDIADNAQLRRSKPCLHKSIGVGLAINAGDFGLASIVGNVIDLYKRYINARNMASLDDVINELVFMEYKTIEGQAMDLGWSQNDVYDISVSDYITMVRKKTSYYSASVPVVLGALFANCKEDAIKCLKSYALNAGLAFQIQDDILNLVPKCGNVYNKDNMSDITEGKRTLMVVYALNNLCGSKKQTLINILKNHEKNPIKLAEAVDILSSCGAIDFAKSYALKLSNEAVKSLNFIKVNNVWFEILKDMPFWAVNREI